MKLRNLAVLVSVFIGFSLVGCEAPEQEAERRPGTHSSCDRDRKKLPTQSLHIIRATDGEIAVTPDPLVQPPGPFGWIGWLSPTHDWRITYEDESPLAKDTYEGESGDIVLDSVRTDAKCQDYTYKVEVWPDTLDEPAPGDIESKTYPATVATDTVNGDQIEPW